MKENNWSLYLKGNEELLWNGKGKADALINAGNKTKLMIRWIACAIVGLGFTAFYLPYAIGHQFPTNNTIISVGVVVAPVSYTHLGDRLEIVRAEAVTKILKLSTMSFLETLRIKMS